MTRRVGIFWGLVMVGVGSLFLLGNLGYFEFTLGTLISEFWPVILIYIGARMVSATYGSKVGSTVTQGLGDEPAVFLPGFSRLIGRYFLGDIELEVDRPIEGGALQVGLGNIELDLSRASPLKETGVLDCVTRVGQVRIRLPKEGEWRVEALCLIGDVTVGKESRDGVAKTIKASSSGYETAPNRLLIRVRAGIGTVFVR